MFKNRKLYKDFVLGIKEFRYNLCDVRRILPKLPIKVIRRIGKEIIYSDYDGYNCSDIDCRMAYFDNLNRRQKQFYIEQRLYKIYEI